jgi:phosphoketolase
MMPMVVLNNLDRYQLALDAISRIPRIAFTSRSMAVLRENVLANHRPPMPSLPTT